MEERLEIDFVNRHQNNLRRFWEKVKTELADFRTQYQWPKGTTLEQSIRTRTELEREIQADLSQQGSVSKRVFDNVMIWGFGSPSGCSEQVLHEKTRSAFQLLREGRIADAARELVGLPRIGISRATKILALSDQHRFGIYDSRSAHGLSDLLDDDGKRIVPIPPGRVIHDGSLPKDEYCRAFEEYVWILRYFRMLAEENPSLRSTFPRVADIEIALFSRSRNGDLRLSLGTENVPHHLKTVADRDEENLYWTLGSGRKSKPFYAVVDASGVTVFTGENRTPLRVTREETNACLKSFGNAPFPLSNTKTAADRNPRGLGEYFARNFGSSVFASHLAALWVHQGLLTAHATNGAWQLQVNVGALPYGPPNN